METFRLVLEIMKEAATSRRLLAAVAAVSSVAAALHLVLGSPWWLLPASIGGLILLNIFVQDLDDSTGLIVGMSTGSAGLYAWTNWPLWLCAMVMALTIAGLVACLFVVVIGRKEGWDECCRWLLDRIDVGGSEARERRRTDQILARDLTFPVFGLSPRPGLRRHLEFQAPRWGHLGSVSSVSIIDYPDTANRERHLHTSSEPAWLRLDDLLVSMWKAKLGDRPDLQIAAIPVDGAPVDFVSDIAGGSEDADWVAEGLVKGRVVTVTAWRMQLTEIELVTIGDPLRFNVAAPVLADRREVSHA